MTLFDGQYHDVDSSEQSFKTAAGMGVREALPKCNPVVLEPIAHVRVIVPTAYTSTVIQQLTGKRGQILGMNPADDRAGFDVVEAYVPPSSSRATSPSCAPRRRDWARMRWRHERYDPIPGGRTALKQPSETTSGRDTFARGLRRERH